MSEMPVIGRGAAWTQATAAEQERDQKREVLQQIMWAMEFCMELLQRRQAEQAPGVAPMSLGEAWQATPMMETVALMVEYGVDAQALYDDFDAGTPVWGRRRSPRKP